MKRFIVSMFVVMGLIAGCGQPSCAAVIGVTASGSNVNQSSLAACKTAAGINKCVVTTPQVISTAIAWNDRGLEFAPGAYVTFTGSGALTKLKEARPEWFGINTTPGTTDMAPAIQNALRSMDKGGTLKLSPNTIYSIRTSIYADVTEFDADWTIEGGGQSTVLQATGIGSNFMLYLNQTSGGAEATGTDTYPGMRFTLRNFTVSASETTSSTTSFARAWQCGVNMEGVRFDYIKYGLRTFGYCDLVKVARCEVVHTVTDGYLYYQHQLGDGLVFEQNTMTPYGTNSGMLYVRGVKNGQVRSNIQGRYVFVDCGNVLFINNHLEVVHGANEKILISNSNVVLRDNTIYNYENTNLGVDTGNYPIYVDDTTFVTAATVLSSHVYLENNRFVVATAALDSGQTHKHGPEIYLGLTGGGASSRDTVVHLRNNKLSFQDDRLTLADYGITVSSSISALNTILTNRWMLLSGDCVIARGINNSYTLLNPNFEETWEASALPQPAKSADPTLITYITGSFTAATYYYTVSAVNFFGETTKATEFNMVVGAGDVAKTVQILMTNMPGCLLKIWRGTSSGTYTHYAAIPQLDGDARLYDRGDSISGVEWSTSVPSLPVANTAYAGSYRTGQQTLIGVTAAPSAGAWLVGDRAIRVPVVGQPKAWSCTVAGSPGTWASEGNL